MAKRYCNQQQLHNSYSPTHNILGVDLTDNTPTTFAESTAAQMQSSVLEEGAKRLLPSSFEISLHAELGQLGQTSRLATLMVAFGNIESHQKELENSAQLSYRTVNSV